MAEHDGKGPAPAWCKIVAKAGGLHVEDMQDMTDEEAYEFIEDLLPGGMKVRAPPDPVCGD
jgi:hypothetical protein